jgi:NLE (NUC135) domain
MASLLPPPKRVKVYHGVPEPVAEPPKPSPNVIVQFVAEEDGKPLAPAVNLPANISTEGLEDLVNKLSSKVGLVLFSILLFLITGDVRTTNLYRLHSISLYPKMQIGPEHQRESSYQNQ